MTEQPYENDKDSNKDVTVKMMIEMLSRLPDDYLVSYDSALGHVSKGDFTIYHDRKKISING